LKLLPRILADDEDEDDEILTAGGERAAQAQGTATDTLPRPLPWPALAAVWAVALVPRLFALFFLTDPENPGDGWHGDVFHHWQIAYLTKEIGLWDANGPRLWDLKGLDYFWGLIHPALLVVLFYVTGSVDIVIPRLVSVFFGALSAVLLFSLCRRYWGLGVAIAAGLFAALLPTSVFIDATGFLEPMGHRAGSAWDLVVAEAWVVDGGCVGAGFDGAR